MFSAPPVVITDDFKDRLKKAPEQVQTVSLKLKLTLTDASPEYKQLQACGLTDIELMTTTLVFVKGNEKSILAASKLSFVKHVWELGGVQACENTTTSSPRLG